MAALCSLNELKLHLRVPTAETALDTVLTTLMDDVTSRCERLTERTFLATGYSNEVYPGNGLNSLLLKNYPVDSAAIFQLKDYSTDIGLTVLDTADYAVDYEKGIVRLRGGLTFAPGPDSARVTYTAGYATSGTGDDEKIGAPDELGRSVRDYAAALHRKRLGAIGYDEFESETKCAEKVWYGYARLR